MVGPTGMTANAASAATSEMPGAMGNRTRSAFAGQMSSLKKSFRASARGCSRPVGPTRLGPMRTCNRLIARRSNQVMYAMPVSRAKMITNERIASTTISSIARAPRRSDRAQIVGQRQAEGRRQARDDAPIGPRPGRRSGAAVLLLDATLEIGDGCLALVRVRHRQEDFDARVVRHRPRRCHDYMRGAGVELCPGFVAQ